MKTILVLLLLTSTARAGELDLNLGLQATTTAWRDDHGGGPALAVGYWLRSWIGAAFVGKEHYIAVDERFASYFSANAAVRRELGRVRLGAMLGVVHQHEQTRAAIEAQPLASLMGIGDGTRHRAGGRGALSVALPFRPHDKGDWYVALDVDATRFTDDDRGPRWMASTGVSVGFTYGAAR